MRKRYCVWLWLFIFGALCSAAQRGAEGASTGEEFVGTWSGSWEGMGASGGFEVTLEKGKDGAVSGGVSVTGEPTYKARFTSLSFDGKKMTAKYDFTPEPAAEVVLTIVFDGNTAKGPWSLREKATGNEAATGSISMTKK